MSCMNKQDMIEYSIEFDRTFGGPLFHLFESEKASKYKGMSACELKTLCYLTDYYICLLYTSPSPRDGLLSRMPSSA